MWATSWQWSTAREIGESSPEERQLVSGHLSLKEGLEEVVGGGLFLICGLEGEMSLVT